MYRTRNEQTLYFVKYYCLDDFITICNYSAPVSFNNSATEGKKVFLGGVTEKEASAGVKKFARTIFL